MSDSFTELESRLEQYEERLARSEDRLRRAEQKQRTFGGLLLVTLVGSVVLSTRMPVRSQTIPQLQQEIAALQSSTKYITTGTDVNGYSATFIKKCNVWIQDGSGSTDDARGPTTGLGNIIIGYNEKRGNGTDDRSGSHNLIIGIENSYSGYSGIAAGQDNTISGQYCSAVGGFENSASGLYSLVCGGQGNSAASQVRSVFGGYKNVSNGSWDFVGGGQGNIANDVTSAIVGGENNMTQGSTNVIIGGENNTTGGVSGGTVVGGYGNNAGGQYSAILGGKSNKTTTTYQVIY